QLLVVRHEPGVAVRAGFPVARHALDADPVREDGIALAARRLAVAAAGARAGAVAHGRLAEVDVRPVVAVAVHTRRAGAVADGLDREVLALPVRLQLCLDADQAVTFAVVAAPLVRPALRDEVLGVRVTHPAEAAARAFAGQVQQEHPVLVDLGVGDGAAATTAEAAAVAAVRAAVHGLGAGVHVDVAVRPVVVVARRAAAARARGTRRRRLVVGRRHRGRRAEPADAAARAVRVGVRVVLRVVERVGHGSRREAREAVRRTGALRGGARPRGPGAGPRADRPPAGAEPTAAGAVGRRRCGVAHGGAVGARPLVGGGARGARGVRVAAVRRARAGGRGRRPPGPGRGPCGDEDATAAEAALVGAGR